MWGGGGGETGQAAGGVIVLPDCFRSSNCALALPGSRSVRLGRDRSAAAVMG